MTKEQLASYKSKLEEIKEIKDKITGLRDDDSVAVSDVIRDYRSGQGIPQTITGVDRNRYWRLHTQYQEQLKKLERDCEEVEQYVEAIKDSLTRRIFRTIYLDGNTQTEASKKLHIDRSVISRKINSYIRRGDNNDT